MCWPINSNAVKLDELSTLAGAGSATAAVAEPPWPTDEESLAAVKASGSGNRGGAFGGGGGGGKDTTGGAPGGGGPIIVGASNGGGLSAGPLYDFSPVSSFGSNPNEPQ